MIETNSLWVASYLHEMFGSYIYLRPGERPHSRLYEETLLAADIVKMGDGGKESAQQGEDSADLKAQGKRTLLVIKDSYAHTFVPFLAQDYDRVIMVDFRYSKMPVSMMVEQFGVTDLLVMYNATNFISDENLYQLER